MTLKVFFKTYVLPLFGIVMLLALLVAFAGNYLD